jgi:hypothetical protein
MDLVSVSLKLLLAKATVLLSCDSISPKPHWTGININVNVEFRNKISHNCFAWQRHNIRTVKATNTEWNWGTEQEAAFEKIKQELSSETVMTYIIPKLDIGTDGCLDIKSAGLSLPGWYVIVNLKGCSLKPQRSIRNGGFSSLPYPTILLRDTRIVLSSELR